MSWDIFIQDLPDVKTIHQIPRSFKAKPLGRREKIIESIKEVLPTVDFTDPAWGKYKDRLVNIEFNMDDQEICDSIVLHVRGGEKAPEVVDKILKYLNFKALDSQSEYLFSLQQAKISFQSWNNYVNSLLR